MLSSRSILLRRLALVCLLGGILTARMEAGTPVAPASSDLLASDPGETAILDEIHAVPPTAPAAPAPDPQVASAGAPAIPAEAAMAPAVTSDPALQVNPATSPAPVGSVPNAGAAAPDPAPAVGSSSPTQNVTINLINLMVKRGLITKGDADGLIKQAEDEAAQAQAQAASTQVSAGPLPSPAVPADGNSASAPAVANEDDSVNVTYIPDAVRKQMTEEVKDDVMKQEQAENWATPRSFPTWASRMTFFGDTRFRFQEDMYPSGNDTTGHFVNFNSINTGAPLNNVAGTPTPYYNVDQNRTRFRMRARFGVDVNLDDGFTTGLRLATGSDNSPVTENQTFGATSNGQGGDFGKYQIWLDRAFLKYQYGSDPGRNVSATIGRFDNPFMHTSMIYADDLGFDGLVVQGKYRVVDGVTPFLTGGAFPVYNTDINFSTYNPSKYSSTDKWLYAGQAGADWKINDDFDFKGAVAFYDYEAVQGQLSDLFIPLNSSDQGNTDDTRPGFAQNGNTYFPIRSIDNSTAANNFGATNQYQYYGLASAFRELAIDGQLDINHFDPFHIQISGEAVKNLAYDYNEINSAAINNLGSNGQFAGGDSGYMVKLLLGSPVLEKKWDWNINLNYRYVETDAVVDGFTDSDFGGALAGTNLEGFTVGGGVALTPHVCVNLRWMSADAIAGPTYKSDLFQFDINSKF